MAEKTASSLIMYSTLSTVIIDVLSPVYNQGILYEGTLFPLRNTSLCVICKPNLITYGSIIQNLIKLGMHVLHNFILNAITYSVTYGSIIPNGVF